MQQYVVIHPSVSSTSSAFSASCHRCYDPGNNLRTALSTASTKSALDSAPSRQVGRYRTTIEFPSCCTNGPHYCHLSLSCCKHVLHLVGIMYRTSTVYILACLPPTHHLLPCCWTQLLFRWITGCCATVTMPRRAAKCGRHVVPQNAAALLCHQTWPPCHANGSVVGVYARCIQQVSLLVC